MNVTVIAEEQDLKPRHVMACMRIFEERGIPGEDFI